MVIPVHGLSNKQAQKIVDAHNAEIDRLRAALTAAEGERDFALWQRDETFAQLTARAEAAEAQLAERDAAIAAAFEAVSRLCWAEVAHREKQISEGHPEAAQIMRWSAGKIQADTLARKIEALTSSEALAAIERVKAEARGDFAGLVEAAKLVLHDIDDLVANSEGVAGLPCGQVADWESLLDGGEFGVWLSSPERLRAALAAWEGKE
jgi:hypothetical protein